MDCEARNQAHEKVIEEMKQRYLDISNRVLQLLDPVDPQVVQRIKQEVERGLNQPMPGTASRPLQPSPLDSTKDDPRKHVNPLEVATLPRNPGTQFSRNTEPSLGPPRFAQGSVPF